MFDLSHFPPGVRWDPITVRTAVLEVIVGGSVVGGVFLALCVPGVVLLCLLLVYPLSVVEWPPMLYLVVGLAESLYRYLSLASMLNGIRAGGGI